MIFSLYSFEGPVIRNWHIDALSFPGHKGATTLLPGHAPLMFMLEVGALSILHATRKKWIHFSIANGFLQSANDHIVVCADTVETAENIDVNRARQAQQKTEERLKGVFTYPRQFEKFWLKKQRAIVRQQVAKNKTPY